MAEHSSRGVCELLSSTRGPGYRSWALGRRIEGHAVVCLYDPNRGAVRSTAPRSTRVTRCTWFALSGERARAPRAACVETQRVLKLQDRVGSKPMGSERRGSSHRLRMGVYGTPLRLGRGRLAWAPAHRRTASAAAAKLPDSRRSMGAGTTAPRLSGSRSPRGGRASPRTQAIKCCSGRPRTAHISQVVSSAPPTTSLRWPWNAMTSTPRTSQSATSSTRSRSYTRR